MTSWQTAVVSLKFPKVSQNHLWGKLVITMERFQEEGEQSDEGGMRSFLLEGMCCSSRASQTQRALYQPAPQRCTATIKLCNVRLLLEPIADAGRRVWVRTCYTERATRGQRWMPWSFGVNRGRQVADGNVHWFTLFILLKASWGRPDTWP